MQYYSEGEVNALTHKNVFNVERVLVSSECSCSTLVHSEVAFLKGSLQNSQRLRV